MNITFENKVALLTGAASGLGLATAKAFAEAGASVVLADWSKKEVQAAAKELADKGHKTLAVTCDVSDDAQVEAMVNKTVAEFGRLDVAYNNAGIQNVLAETADSPRADYDRVMGVNLRGVWSCQLFGPTPHHVLLEAKSIESFTETKLRTNARAIQLAPTVFETSKIEASADSNLAGSG